MKGMFEKWAPIVLMVCGWMLITAGEARGQRFDDCIQNINNATVVVPTSVQADIGGTSLEAGDEIALFTDGGTCAGHGVWNGESLSIAAAGTGSQTSKGFEIDEPLQFRVWDASAKQMYEATVNYEPCDGGSSICEDDGRYEHNVLFSLTELSAAETLPVELTSFDATVDGMATILQWETASETNNAGFEIQHQGPQAAADEWTRVGFVEGRGTTSEVQRYSHRLQELSPGTHRFRLKQVDLDGTVTYSSSVEAVVELQGTYDLVAPYPNPFRQRATFALTVAEAQRVNVAAYNQLGQHVATLHSGTLEPNTSHTFRLDGERLSSGVYFIQIRGEQFSATKRAILVR